MTGMSTVGGHSRPHSSARTEAQSLIHGRFEVLKELGRGTGGVVYLVHDRLRRAQVVLKHFWPNQGEQLDQQAPELFQVLTRVRHRALPNLLDWGQDESGRSFYTKTFAHGTPGDEVAGQMTCAQVATVAWELAETVSLMHRAEYCHGDLKPHNLLVRLDEDTAPVHLLDFGLIFRTDTEIEGLRGTPLYLAPETFRGAGPGIETDIYALGATLYHLLYGTPPYLEKEAVDTDKDASNAALMERLLEGPAEHPPRHWRLLDDASDEEHSAFEALQTLIEGLMSPEPKQRRQVLASLPERLARWAPPVSEDGFGIFVGRSAEQETLRAWFDANFKSPESRAPLMLLEGPEGSGRTHLMQVVTAPLRDKRIPVLEHTPVNSQTDTLLDDLARQLLITAPTALGKRRTELLQDLALGNDTGMSHGGEDARRHRLIRHMMHAARHQRLAVVIRGVHGDHPSFKTLTGLARHLEADRTRKSPARMAVLVIGTKLAPLASGLTQVERLELGSLSEMEVSEFLHGVLPEKARPDNLGEVVRLTEGIPLRLVEMARSLLEANREGEAPTGEVLRRAADFEGELARRLDRPGKTSRAILMTLAVVERPLALAQLRQLLPNHMPRTRHIHHLTQDGFVRQAVGHIGGLEQSDTPVELTSEAVRRVVLERCWDNAPKQQILIERFADLLRANHALHPDSVEPLDVLQWSHLAGRLNDIAREAIPIARRYHLQQRHVMALQVMELAETVALDLDEPGTLAPVLMEMMGLTLALDQPTRSLEIGQRLLSLWCSEEQLSETLLGIINEPPAPETVLKRSWSEHLALVPGTSKPTTEDEIHRATALSHLILAASQSGRVGAALAFTWQLIPTLIQSGVPEVWPSIFRALAPILFRTSFRVDLLAAVQRTVRSPKITARITSADRAALLNLQGGLLEVTGQASEAIESYEDAMFTGRQQGVIPNAVLTAISNLARLMGMRGELPMARHYLHRGIRQAEQQGYISSQFELLRNLGSQSNNGGQPYAGLTALEEAHRLAISTGRKDALTKVSLSLLSHYGNFGMKSLARGLYEKMSTSERNSARWDIHHQYAYALGAWGEIEPIRGLLERVKTNTGEDVLGRDGRASQHVLEGMVALHDKLFNSAIREVAEALKILKHLPMPWLKIKALKITVEANLHLGNLLEASHRQDELESEVKKASTLNELPQVHHLRALLAEAQGNMSEVRKYCERAKEALDAQIADMPEAYRADYMLVVARQAIVRDAERSEGAERDRMMMGMRRILEIVQRLHYTSERGLSDLLSEVLAQMIDFNHAERGVLFKVERLEGEIPLNDDGVLVELVRDGVKEHWMAHVAFARGFNQQDLGGKRARASRTVIQRILEKNAPIFSADAIEDMRFLHSGSIATQGVRSILAVPLRSEGAINGVIYLDSKQIRQFSDDDKNLLDLLGDQLGPVVERAHEREHAQNVSGTFPRIIGRSTALHRVLDMACQVAKANVPVMILGSTGTGKELMAQGIHEASYRGSGPFVTVNCAALPEGLVESELFGHERGAFTGAIAKKIGYFQQAEGGTIFLDEIGEMPLALQSKLLRVLQEKTIRPLGSKREINIDVRIITATHRDLEQWASDGQFREDLFYRLNVVPLVLPDLKDRSEDIPLMARHFFSLFREQHDLTMPPLSGDVMKTLQDLPWPGNIRQLRNALQRAMLFSAGRELTPQDIADAAGKVQNQPNMPVAPAPTYPGYPPGAIPYGQGYPQHPGYPPQPYYPQQPMQGQWHYPQQPMQGYPPQPYYPQQPPMQGYHPGVPGQPHAGFPQQPPQAPWHYPPQPPQTQWVPPAAPANPSMHAPLEPSGDESVDNILPMLQVANGPPQGEFNIPANYTNAKAMFRYKLAVDALAKAKGNKTKAAEIMGITRQSLYRILAQGKGHKD